MEAASVPAAAAAVPRLRTVAIVAGLLAAFGGRLALAWLHATPVYFPDEYLYSALGRSLSTFDGPSVRGAAAHFPALLQPLVTAAAWRLGDLETAFRAVQVLESAIFTLAAVPVYLLARATGVGRRTALAVAAGALIVPDALFAGFVLAEPIAYPLALAAVAAGVAAIARPRRSTQVAFLAFALLATFARLQLGVLPLCFLATVVAVGLRERRVRSVLREQRLPLVAIGGVLLAGFAGVAVRGLGYYDGAKDLQFVPASFGRNAVVLLYAGGWACMPAAAVGIWVAVSRPATRAQAAFGWLTAFFAAALFFEAAVWGDTHLAQERYLFYLLPLALVAFGLQAQRGWPHRRAQALLALAMLLLSTRAPLTGWAALDADVRAPFLLAMQRLEFALGAGNAAVAVATAAGCLSVVAAVAPWRPRIGGPLVLGLALAGSAAALAGATSFDRMNTAIKLRVYLPETTHSWIDAQRLGPATLVVAAGARPSDGEQQLFWNRSLRRVAVLPGAQAPDPLASSSIRIADDGSLLTGGRPLRGPLVIGGYWSTVVLRDARVVARAPSDTLWLPAGDAKLRLSVVGRATDGYLWSTGSIDYWADGPGKLVVDVKGNDVQVGAHQVKGAARLTFPACSAGRLSIPFRSTLEQISAGRPVGGTMTLPRFVPGSCRG